MEKNSKESAPFFDIKNQETPDAKMSVSYGNEYVKNQGNGPDAGPFKAYRTDMRVPHPTNSSAKVVPSGKVMRQVLTGK